VSADLPIAEVRRTIRAVRVQAVFHVASEQQAQAVAGKLVDRAHEIANLPECECDVDMSVEMAPPNGSPAPVGPGGAPPHGRTPNS
jgi:hypothetical protein